MTLNEFLTSEHLKRIPGRILFTRVSGSHGHNMALPTSDRDFFVVYVVPTQQVLGLYPYKDTVREQEGKKPDFEAHEVGKFCDLLLKGNPGVLESLFSASDPDMVMFGIHWAALMGMRRRFLSKRVIAQYVGYAKSQLHRAQHGQSVHTTGGKVCEKWNYHLTRLLSDGLRIVKGTEPRVWVHGGERETLMAIRRGEIPQERVEEMANVAIAEIDRLLPNCPWPDEGDRAALNEWLLGVRKYEFVH
jgi:hypothetical protein